MPTVNCMAPPFVESDPANKEPRIGPVQENDTSAKVSADTVYQVTKAMYSDATQKTLAAGHAKGKMITMANAVLGVGIPFHAGAEKFYKEAGLLK